MNIFRKPRELIVIRNPFEPQEFEQYKGHDLDALIRQAFPQGINDSVRFYHGNLLQEVFTERDKQGVDKLLKTEGRIYAMIKPMGLTPVDWIVIGVSMLVSVAVSLLMPMPNMNQAANQPPSPNNSLAQRSNKQRLGGRIPDIFGTVWSFPDLIAPTYSVYIDHQEVEFSYMCVGRGYFNVEKAYDDTTPINQVNGSTALVFDPNKTLNDTPSFVFGSQFNSDEATWSRLATKRYTSVNGQVLAAPDNYLTGTAFTFKNPNIIETDSNIDLTTQFAVGNKLLIEGADNLVSGNGLVDANGEPIKYSLNGSYIISAITSKQITLENPSVINADWGKLAANTDFATSSDKAAISTETSGLWQGWFYTDGTDHDSAYVNIVAPGLWLSQPNGKWVGLKVFGAIESELVDSGNNPIAGTNHVQRFDIKSPNFDKHSSGNGDVRGNPPSGYVRTSNETTDDKVRESAAITIKIENPYFGTGKRLRIRVSRSSSVIYDSDSSVVQEIKLKDFYGTRLMANSEMPSDVTTVYTKTKATEGALAVKERKLRLLVQRYVKNWQDNDNLILSNRADDIIYHIARDEKLANLQPYQIDMAQIKAEIDAVIDNFKTPLCAEFCYTFDDNNVSAEEMLQIVAKAVFSTCYRFNNQLKLLFERSIPVSVAIFNSHNILPDTFDKSESFGNEYDGVIIDYVEPVDDATMTINTSDSLANPKKDKIMGVRNKVQAYMHMMRVWNKLQYSYKSCEFTGGDESGIVIRSNRITVADQSRADVQQGSVENLEMIDNKIVLSTSNRVSLDNSSHTLFVQTVDGNVDAIPCSTLNDYQVVLSRLPSGKIAIGHDNVVNAVYQIVKTQDTGRDAYLVSEKSPEKGLTNRLTCINYDERYYQNDSDYHNNLIPTTTTN